MQKAKNLPPYHRDLKQKSLYPEATHQIKFIETRTAYWYKTGVSVYSIKKENHDYRNLAMKEMFLHEALKLGEIFAEGIYQEVVPISQTEQGYSFASQGTIVEYALKMQQLNDRYFLNHLLAKDKVKATGISAIAKKLASIHSQMQVEKKASEVGRPENLYELCEDALFQSKKWIGTAVTEAMLLFIRRPLEKFVMDHKKLFLKRIKKGRIVHNHGAFVPKHIYLFKQDIFFLSPHLVHPKLKFLDAANDVATFLIELERLAKDSLAEVFLKRYMTAAKDRDLVRILPAYQVLITLHHGIQHCEWADMTESEEEKTQLLEQASQYFNMAVRYSEELSDVEQ